MDKKNQALAQNPVAIDWQAQSPVASSAPVPRDYQADSRPPPPVPKDYTPIKYEKCVYVAPSNAYVCVEGKHAPFSHKMGYGPFESHMLESLTARDSVLLNKEEIPANVTCYNVSSYDSPQGDEYVHLNMCAKDKHNLHENITQTIDYGIEIAKKFGMVL